LISKGPSFSYCLSVRASMDAFLVSEQQKCGAQASNMIRTMPQIVSSVLPTA
jgi:hypothetical protein